MVSPWYVALVDYLPDSIVSIIAKKLINKLLKKYADINVIDGENLENLDEPVIFICNHLSNSDGIVMNKVLKKQDVTFVAGVKLSKNKYTNLGRYVVKTITITPNKADKEAMSIIIKTVKKGNNVLICPEGTRSRDGAMIEAKKGILLIQKLSKAKIVPIGIYGSEKLLPINDGGMELERFHAAVVNVKIGKPVELLERQVGEDKHFFEDRAMNHVMKSIAVLLPESYRGVYKD